MQLLKKILTSILLCVFFYSGTIAAKNLEDDKKPDVTFTLIKNDNNEQTYTATIVLTGLNTLPHKGEWELAFNSVRPILSIDNAKLIPLKQGGDFYLMKFTAPKDQDTMTFNIKGKWFINKNTDAPCGYFLVEDKQNGVVENADPMTIPISAKNILPPWQPGPGEDEESKNKVKNNTSIEGNPIDTSVTTETSLIIPIPAQLERRPGQFILNSATKIIYQAPIAKTAAEFFAQAIQPATGFTLAVESQTNQVVPNTILLTTEGINFQDPKQNQEGYSLEVTPSLITIRALTDAGFFYGLQSLRQLLPPEIFSQQIQHPTAWTIPSLLIRDYPRFEYRGLQLDVARHFVSAPDVKRLIDLMAIHKLNYFQWHLADDEGWRIEIKQYPELTQKGAWRGYHPATYSEHDLLPAFGSGATTYGGFYTQQDIREIVNYAKERHITIVPEIDMPGHARALIMSLPQLLIDQEDKSQYTSIQGYHDNVLAPCKNETFTVIDNIMTEVAQLFPGKYIHVGGDEVPNGVWEKSCMAKKYNPQDPAFKDLVQNDFMQKVESIISSKNKIMAGWEEIAGEKSTLSAPLRVYIWNSSKIDQVYKKATHAGYEIIMGPAENLYFDLSYSRDPNEPGQYWAGYVDTFSPYSFRPIVSEKGQNEAVIKGVQGHLWSEMIDSKDRLDYLAFPKVIGLSELAWSPATRRNWKNFAARMREKHLPRLDYYGVHYRPIEFANSSVRTVS